jgi:hypothetical protein
MLTHQDLIEGLTSTQIQEKFGAVKKERSVEVQASSKGPEIQLAAPELIDRQSKGKFVWVPKVLRDYIYVTLDMDGIFHRGILNSDESKINPSIQRRQIKNDYSVPLSTLLVRLEEIKELIKENGTDNLTKEGQKHLDSLLELLTTENDAILDSFRGDKQQVVTVEQLHLLLNRKNEPIIYDDGETKLCFLTQKCEIQLGWFPCLAVSGIVYINMGDGIKAASYTMKLPYFDGYRALKELGISLPDDDKDLLARLVERGKKYVELVSNPAYVRCTGTISRKSWFRVNRFKANGRVMIDVANMRNVDPSYSAYFSYDVYGDRGEPVTTTSDFTDIQYAAMSPYVYGFSFVSKVWGEMRMDDLSEIVFRDDAYDMLVMDRDTKDMVFALVDNSVTGAKDFIDGKGGGCIFLLAGPPGGGKTLTAEAIAEKLQRPLHMVGVGELGTNVESLEENLRRILDIASAWNAVLLIDECDIFMESRTDNDIERNAMVGVFLRLLEYYDGVLFLTSNRAGNIDEAFYSRISMSLYYDPLGVDARKTVWTNLLRVYDVENIDVEQIAHYELNGRKIKGVIRIAKALAASENRDPTVADFTRVIDKESQFRHSIRHNVL